jgi:hypothetical protein
MQSLPIDSLERYAFADLAAGKDARTRNKHRRARQCVVVGARDWLNRWFWLYVWAGYLTASDFKEKILWVQEEFEPRRFGLEANGMQVLFGSLVREEAKLRFGRIKMMEIYQPTNVEKNYRIRTGIEPTILQGRFFLQESEVDARTELQGFPTAMTKDIVDAMETCMSRVAPKRPRKAADDTEREEYAAYLRASGLPAHLINQEVGRFGSGARFNS